MKNTKLFTLGLLGILTLSLSGSAFADPYYGHGGMPHRPMPGKYLPLKGDYNRYNRDGLTSYERKVIRDRQIAIEEYRRQSLRDDGKITDYEARKIKDMEKDLNKLRDKLASDNTPYRR